jgi:hypothetical protein
MSIRETIDESNRSSSLSCPHCNAGMDGVGLGLIWDFGEDAWRCILCGHRTFQKKQKTKAEILEETLWDRILASISLEEDSENTRDANEEEADNSLMRKTPGKI